LDKDFIERNIGSVPGENVLLSVSDTGCGMNKETISRIFEPFFTTKEKGTGLGLATVYGIVKQSGGYITVYSEPGIGTTFKIYLPRTLQDEQTTAASDLTPGLSRGSETILLVDDNESVRSAIGALLQMHGYIVLQAGTGQEAMEVSQKYQEGIDLLITDMVMPRMSGSELAERLISQRPQLKVLYMSGFTEEAMLRRGALQPGRAFLQKPAPMNVLMRKIQELLKPGPSEGFAESEKRVEG
jgi:CheY-like chemotaxis protein